ncbi:MAG: PTS sugar transporter subunit IIA [Candidatus Omnitrophota bacterium]
MTQIDVLTAKELAEYLKLNEKTVIKMAKSGELPGFKIGSQWRFYLSIVNVYLHDKVMKASGSKGLSGLVDTSHKIFPLSRLTDATCIDLYLKSETEDGVLRELAAIAQEAGVAISAEKAYEKLKEREDMLSTAVGGGIAIPHSRNPNEELFRKPAVIIGRSLKGVDFGAPDGKKVYLFFVPCSPDVVLHLNLLSKIARLLNDQAVYKKLMDVRTNDEVMKILLESERGNFELLNQISEFRGKQFPV